MVKIKWREPLGRPECPYCYRWVIPLGPLGSLRLHHWVGSDDLRAYHDHPSNFLTLIIWGGYWDETATGMEWLGAGSIRYRPAWHTHSVALAGRPCWSLLWFSHPFREWGFWDWTRGHRKFRWFSHTKYFYERGLHQCET